MNFKLRQCVSLCAVLAGAAPALATTPQVVAAFDASKLETPESIALDSCDNRYVSLALTGEVRKITVTGAQSTFAQLPLEPPLTFCPNGLPTGIQGIAFDFYDNLYVAVGACDPAVRGIWKVTQAGTQQRIAAMPLDTLANGIAWHDHTIYTADTFQGVVWSMPDDGSAAATIWAAPPDLAPIPGVFAPAANGLQIYADTVYTAQQGKGLIIAIPIKLDGTAGTPRTVASGVSCDDFAFDLLGNIYCGTDPLDTFVLIRPDGSQRVLLTQADGLDGPTAAAFGRGLDTFSVYITNASYPFYPNSQGHPTLMELFIGIPGAPRPWP